MDPHHPDDPRHDHAAQRKADRGRLLRALNFSLALVLLLILVYSAQGSFDWRPFAVAPMSADGLVGLLTAPLLHGSVEHIAANSVALLMLGTLAGSVYPRATLWSLPLLWLGSGLGAWLLGDAGSRHLGASGVTHGMLLTVLPHEPGVSWQSHLGGAVAGLLAALLFRKLDPALPRKRYSWEDEEENLAPLDDELEPPVPREVPVLWHRTAREEERGVVLRFPPRD